MSCQFAFALVLGILLAEYGSWQIFLLTAMLAAAVFFPQFSKKNYRECVLRGVLLIAAGAIGAGCYVRQANRWEKECQELICGQQLSVCGTLIRKEQKNERWQLTLALPGYENRVVVSSEEGGYPLESVLSVRGLVREFNTPRNEGQFNEKQYYKNRKTVGRMSVEEIVCLRVPSGVQAWREELYLWRTHLAAVYEACLPAPESGILATMAVGEKSLMDADVRGSFQRVGLSHILAISGMHISMIGMGIYSLLRRCRCPYVRCALVTACMLLLYGTMIGMGVSASRAIGMFLLYLLAQCVGRGYDTCSALAVLASLLLLENPFLLQDASFQFSFLAVFGVVTTGMILPKKEDGGRGYRLTYPLCVALLLQLFTLPLVAYHYYEVPLYALFLNLLLLPYLGAALGFGLVGGCVGTFFLPLTRFLLLPCRIVLSVYVYVCEIVEKCPFSSVICGEPTAGKLWVYYGLLAGMLLVLAHVKKCRSACSGDVEENDGMKEICGLMIVGAFTLLTILLHAPAGGFEIDYLDVGQGDGSMLRTEDGVVCFIDGGSTDVTGVGTYRILPFLKSKGIRKVDYWILSHLDEDHVNGFYEVLESGYPVDTVVISEQIPEGEAKAYLSEMLMKHDIPVINVNGGDVLQLQKKNERGVFFSCGRDDPRCDLVPHISFLAPDETTPVYDCNGASLVCLYEDAQIRVLWPGDIGKSQEEWLLQTGKLQEIDIYKAAHHGSKYSNSAEYLQRLAPKMAVISCGERNRYGHPGAEAIAHMEATGSRIFYTMNSGQIKIQQREDGLMVEEFL